MATVNMNLSDAQINAIETILDGGIDNPVWIIITNLDGRISKAMERAGIIAHDTTTGQWTITAYGIQSYCATILTKYDGATHERIHGALGNWQRLFN